MASHKRNPTVACLDSKLSNYQYVHHQQLYSWQQLTPLLTRFFLTLQPPRCSQVLYTIKARTVVMVSSSRGAGLSASQVAAEDAASGGDGGSMSSAALERVVDTATATYNEW